MKLRVIATCAATLVAAVPLSVMAESSSSKSGIRINLDELPPPAPAQPAQKTAAPKETAKPAANPKSKAAEKKEDAPAKIEGMEISRGDRGFLGVKIENNHFKISFYDAKRKPMVADVSRIALRWPVHYQPNPERAVLTPTEDGKAMTSEKVVRAPFSFKLFITLLKDTAPGEEPAAETYVVDFQG